MLATRPRGSTSRTPCSESAIRARLSACTGAVAPAPGIPARFGGRTRSRVRSIPRSIASAGREGATGGRGLARLARAQLAEHGADHERLHVAALVVAGGDAGSRGEHTRPADRSP